ncbi:23S ribosomal RNA methyltransferase Erm [Bacillus horti]|uniref:rRNA adenine N-6-methyltransferase n=1 Tax=Caldalkalibacillus horti TaxID=77523 RepID=A0ABT9W3W4_9BACI|nr:23S ribosomal RNA methyltransferase Erm [Bacillus horti]MDQ0167926.1 23S rRNA (adenine-N6)-dimethyltransferase [Bacillus horti]
MRKQNKGHRKVRKNKAGPNFSGQHLMHNKQIIQDIVALGNVSLGDTVVEIGAGKGALTFPLAEKAGKVIAIENDRAFTALLRTKLQDMSNVQIVERDFLESFLPQKSYKVVANIPYAITTPIMNKLLSGPTDALKQAVLMIEEGAAKRFTGQPITNPYILAWRMWFDIHLVQVVPRRHFSPPPKVDSAIILIRRKEQTIPKGEYYRFLGLAQWALKHPQNPIYVALQDLFTPPQLKRLMRSASCDRSKAISSLTLHQWSIVFQTMKEHVQPVRWPKGKKGRI